MNQSKIDEKPEYAMSDMAAYLWQYFEHADIAVLSKILFSNKNLSLRQRVALHYVLFHPNEKIYDEFLK